MKRTVISGLFLMFAACGDEALQTADTVNVEDTAVAEVEVEDTALLEIIVFDTFVPESDTGGALGDTGNEEEVAASCSDSVKPFFCPCDNNNQCASGYCIGVDEAEVARRCTQTCLNSCPEGWECKGTSGAGDPVFICQPPVNTLCDACEQDSDCQVVGALCIGFEDGKYCGRDCAGRETSCPSGYQCGEVLNEVGQIEGYQCLRTSGSCNCPDGTDYANDPANCGACGNVCKFAGGVPGCRNETCFLSACENDWKDLNLVESDGCEYRCTYSSGDDWPDGSCDSNNGCDQNCDGIDGDWERAIFVNASAGAGGTGSYKDPVKTISEGISKALSSGRDHVYVAAGTYNESVVLKAGVSVFGGYASDGTWKRNLAQHKTTITWSAGANSVRVVTAEGINVRTVLDGVEVVAGTNANPGGSSYAIWVKDSTNALTFVRVSAVGGSGGPGANGTAGARGPDGENGSDGTPGSDDSWCDEPGQNCDIFGNCSGPPLRGYGGRPGDDTCPTGINSAGGAGGKSGCDAHAAYSPEGGYSSPGGAAGGTAPNTKQAGGNGANGSTPSPGVNGAGGSGGTIDANGFWKGNAGGAGAQGPNGVGGGGGAGGGGNDSGTFGTDAWGGGGGGGGSGGCGGTGGTAGGAGGGSFGIFLFNASPRLESSALGHKSGGNGGNGGAGGGGGTGKGGGAGASGSSGGGTGGRGGTGGNGARGGHGGGGSGGIAYGLYLAGTSNPTCTTVTFSPVGSGGTGGLGGTSQGNQGSTGAFGDKNKASANCP
jgi:hypothetical protein